LIADALKYKRIPDCFVSMGDDVSRRSGDVESPLSRRTKVTRERPRQAGRIHFLQIPIAEHVGRMKDVWELGAPEMSVEDRSAFGFRSVGLSSFASFGGHGF
jgi:hypothetical protein